jgi:hypothetical protein
MTRAAHPQDRVGAVGEGSAERPPFTDVDQLVAWLDAMPPLDRARVAALLVDAETTRVVGRVRRTAVYQLTRSMTYADAAAELGCSASAINYAVTGHLRDAR